MLILNHRTCLMKPDLTKFLFVLFVFSLGYISSYSQETSVRGLIMDKQGTLKVAGASIDNISSGSRTMSDQLGLFRIRASARDTLIVSKPGYTDLWLVLTDLSDQVLRLQPVIQLSEVKVQGQSKKQELDELREQYRKKGSYYAGKPPVLAYIFQPLTALYELVGKTPGQARRFNAYYMTELQQSEIDRRFNSYTVGNITGLEGNDLKNFIVIYRPDYQLLSAWDEYGLINYINRSFQTFNNSGRPKGLLSLPPLPKAPDLTERNLKY